MRSLSPSSKNHRSRPEFDPTFWKTATVSQVSALCYRYGRFLFVRQRITVVAADGRQARFEDRVPRESAGIVYLGAYLLMAAKSARVAGFTAGIRACESHISRVEAQAASLLPAAIRVAEDKKRAHDAKTRERRLKKMHDNISSAILRHAALFSEEEVVRLWQDGIALHVHSS